MSILSPPLPSPPLSYLSLPCFSSSLSPPLRSLSSSLPLLPALHCPMPCSDAEFFSNMVVAAVVAVKQTNQKGEVKCPISSINIFKVTARAVWRVC